MLKGLAITPPVIGRISIGRVVEKNGKRLPEKDDQFTITTQVQNRDGWILHPLDGKLRKEANAKLRSIPVRVLFNDPDLNLRAEFSAFDKETGRPVCVGNGETCRRAMADGVKEMACPSPEGCDFGWGKCKPYGRLNVVIDVEGDEAKLDELGSFIFRTTSFNSIRTLAARLHYFKGVSGDVLAAMPLELKIRGKSTTQSHRSAIYYVDLTVRAGLPLEEAIKQAKVLAQIRQGAGFSQIGLDNAARQGFANGAFEETIEEAVGVVEEFYSAEEAQSASPEQQLPHAQAHQSEPQTSLSQKLASKVTSVPA